MNMQKMQKKSNSDYMYIDLLNRRTKLWLSSGFE
jgi:hypothetical protein